MAFPQDVLSTKVEIWYDQQWNEITSDVRGTGTEDGEIEIDPRGQPDESSGMSVAQCSLSVNNRDGKYSPRNFVSPLYGKIGINSPIRIITDVSDTANVEDDFSTDGTNGWPNADSGHVWTSLGTAADYLTSAGLAYHRHAAVNVEHRSSLDALEVTDFDCLLEGIACEAAPTGDAVAVVLRGRMSGAGADYVQARVVFFSGTVFLNIDQSEDGVFSSSDADTVDGVTDADTISIRFRSVGRDLYLRAWETGTTEPSTWNITVKTPVITPGQMAVISVCGASLSNTLPFDVTFQEISFNLGIILFTGEVTEWPKRWDKTGNDVWVTLEASGLTRRLSQGNKPVGSPLYRHLKSLDLTGYWSFENMEGTGYQNLTVASDLDNGASLHQLYPLPDRVAAIKFSDEDTLKGSDPLGSVYLGASNRDFNYDYIGYGSANLLQTSATHDSFSVSVWNRVELRTDEANPFLETVVAVEMQNFSDVAFYLFTIQYSISATVPTVTVFANGYTNAPLTNPVSATYTATLTPEWHNYQFAVERAGTDIVLRIIVDGAFAALDTYTTTATGQPAILNTLQMQSQASSSIGLSFGHLAIASGVTSNPLLDAVTDTVSIGLEAYAGELAADRLTRLFAEEGINFELDSGDSATDPDPGTELGPQRSDTFLNLVQAAAQADDGVLFEMREDFGYRYRTRWALYGRTTALELDYANADLSEVPETTDDDQRLRNKIIVKRDGGAGQVVAEQTTGPLSTNDPRAAIPGAGLYDDSATVNLFSDDQRLDYANWRKYLGTWDESRFPGVSVALHRTQFTGNKTKMASAALLDIAEILTIVNPPVWLPPDSVVLQVRSVKIFLSNFNWGIDWSCLPGRPWQEVATASAEYGRADTASSSLVSAVDDNDTEFVVTTAETDLPWTDPLWTEDISELNILGAQGIDLRLNPATIAGGLGGERVRVAKNEVIVDGFTRSGQLSGSNAETGQTWVSSSGTAADATTDGTRAVLVHPTDNTQLHQSLPGAGPDACIECDVSFNIASATGGSFFGAITFRQTDLSNFYSLIFELGTASATTAVVYMRKTVAGVATNMHSFSVAHASAATVYRVKIEIRNGDFLIKIWDPATETEGTWTRELRGYARDLLTGDSIALRTTRAPGNTNTNPAVYFDNLKVTNGRVRPYIYDRFARTVSNGLGDTTTGETWTLWGSGGGDANDYDVAPNTASIVVPDVNNAFRGAYLAGTDLRNACVSYTWECPITAGSAYRPGCVTLRMDGTSSFILWTMTQSSSETLTATIVNASGTNLGSKVLWANLPNATVRMRTKVACYEDQIMGKVWPPESPEPDFWQFVVTDPNPVVSGHVGWFQSRDNATGVAPTILMQDFRVDNPQKITVQRGMDGVSRAWDAGTDVRLWTPARVAR